MVTRALIIALLSALMISQDPMPDRKARLNVWARQDDAATAVQARSVAARESAAQARSRSANVLRQARLVLPACLGNELPGSAPVDSMCSQAAQMCQGSPDPEDLMFWIYAGPPGVASPAPNQWTPTGQACLTPQQATGQTGGPVVTADDFRRLPLPPGRIHVQPASGRTLINVPTNVYVKAAPVIIPTTVLGTAVRVRATPVEYAWAFGDGAGLRTSDPGAPYPDLRTTHTYTTPGSMRLTLTTIYRGEYAVTAGPWQPVDGTAAVASPPQTLTVLAARAELVDDTLPAS